MHYHTPIVFFNPLWYYRVNSPFSTFIVFIVFLALIIYLILAAIKKYKNKKHPNISQSTTPPLRQ